MSRSAPGTSTPQYPKEHTHSPHIPQPLPSSPTLKIATKSPALSPDLFISTLKKLNKTRSQLRLHLLQTTQTPFQNIHVGALIFHGPSLLIIRHNIGSLCCYDIPSRKMLVEDPSVAHALSDIVAKQTGLKATVVVRELLPDFEFKIPRMVAGTQCLSRCVQMNFVVEVQDYDLVLGSRNENMVWIEEGDESDLDMPDGVRGLVRWAFANHLINGK
jgi:hypothetical protein